jgi:NAD(P)-dependent dehydrogenase (short-subunit alcohol dehydrogenase family)
MGALDGKYVMITGASRGLGRALALAFAREGAAGLALVARGVADLDEVARVVAEAAPGALVHRSVADVGDAADVERAVATTLEAFGGRLDALDNNASALGPSPMPYLVDYPADEFRRVLETNLVAPFLLIKKLLPALVERAGSVVNVTSAAGVTGYPGWGAYGISKFGIEGLSETWAAELDGTGVRVNWVDPGDMNTEMHRAAEPDEDPSEWADPGEVTGVFVYLVSDASAEVTGRRFEAQSDDAAWAAAS